MPPIDPASYGKKSRTDGKPGWVLITPTNQRFVENDDSDVRLDRVRVFDPDGNLVGSYLRDKLGVRFVDNLSGTQDDPEYLERLLPKRPSGSPER